VKRKVQMSKYKRYMNHYLSMDTSYFVSIRLLVVVKRFLSDADRLVQFYLFK